MDALLFTVALEVGLLQMKIVGKLKNDSRNENLSPRFRPFHECTRAPSVLQKCWKEKLCHNFPSSLTPPGVHFWKQKVALLCGARIRPQSQTPRFISYVKSSKAIGKFQFSTARWYYWFLGIKVFGVWCVVFFFSINSSFQHKSIEIT